MPWCAAVQTTSILTRAVRRVRRSDKCVSNDSFGVIVYRLVDVLFCGRSQPFYYIVGWCSSWIFFSLRWFCFACSPLFAFQEGVMSILLCCFRCCCCFYASWHCGASPYYRWRNFDTRCFMLYRFRSHFHCLRCSHFGFTHCFWSLNYLDFVGANLQNCWYCNVPGDVCGGVRTRLFTLLCWGSHGCRLLSFCRLGFALNGFATSVVLVSA